MKYRVRFYYHATGMEDGPDERDLGEVEAASAEEAMDSLAARIVPKPRLYTGTMTDCEFFRGCLQAKAVAP